MCIALEISIFSAPQLTGTAEEALVRHRQTLELGRPVPGQVRALSDWMGRTSMGNVFLEGPDRNIWRNPDMDDLASLAPPSAEAKFTNKYTVALVQLYHDVVGRHIHVSYQPRTSDYGYQLYSHSQHRQPGQRATRKTPSDIQTKEYSEFSKRCL